MYANPTLFSFQLQTAGLFAPGAAVQYFGVSNFQSTLAVFYLAMQQSHDFLHCFQSMCTWCYSCTICPLYILPRTRIVGGEGLRERRSAEQRGRRRGPGPSPLLGQDRSRDGNRMGHGHQFFVGLHSGHTPGWIGGQLRGSFRGRSGECVCVWEEGGCGGGCFLL